MLSKEEIDQLAEIVRGVIREELDARNLKKSKDKTAADRMRRYRERRAEQAAEQTKESEPVTRNRNVTSRSKRNASEGNAVTLRNEVTAGVWNAYVAAYEARYRVPPVRNGRVNGMLAKFVQRVPSAEAAQIAAFYVSHNQAFYLRAKHDVSLLLRDAEGLRTEWVTGNTVTDAEARQMDATAARGNVWGKLIDEVEHGRQ